MRSILCLLVLVALAPPVIAEPEPLRLTDDDRVVFVGSTIVERDQEYGFFETYLHQLFPTANFTYRNFGWSGDTVWGEARAEFGPPEDGYKRLVSEVTSARPTVLLIAYGMNESFEGEAGLAKFAQQYNTLLNDLTKTDAKIWLIGPNRHEDLGRPLPDPVEHNKQLKAYSDAIAGIAAQRRCGFVSLYDLLPADRALTDNGIHFTQVGYATFGAMLASKLAGTATPTINDPTGFVQIRKLVNQKNREYFYRWRPQNDTYIYLFRKHEQGQNAVEIPQFDPIVAKLEAQIADVIKSRGWAKP
jgi:lysophospholipase L1-like esterase